MKDNVRSHPVVVRSFFAILILENNRTTGNVRSFGTLVTGHPERGKKKSLPTFLFYHHLFFCLTSLYISIFYFNSGNELGDHAL